MLPAQTEFQIYAMNGGLDENQCHFQQTAENMKKN